MIESPALSAVKQIRHVFFTRRGGVSTGIYAALNCGYGSNDDPARIAENRSHCAGKLGVEPGALLTVYQVHGTEVAAVEKPWTPETAPKADAMVANGRGIALGILTADCAPILLADSEAGVIGAAHAGWKGAKSGVAASVVAAMTRLGAEPSRIVAAIGPSIGPQSYEVGPEFRDAFLADDPAAARFFAGSPGARPHFDLQGFVASRLETLGLARVDRIAADTCAEEDKFFSYRRTCLNRETDYGRQISAIALT